MIVETCLSQTPNIKTSNTLRSSLIFQSIIRNFSVYTLIIMVVNNEMTDFLDDKLSYDDDRITDKTKPLIKSPIRNINSPIRNIRLTLNTNAAHNKSSTTDEHGGVRCQSNHLIENKQDPCTSICLKHSSPESKKKIFSRTSDLSACFSPVSESSDAESVWDTSFDPKFDNLASVESPPKLSVRISRDSLESIKTNLSDNLKTVSEVGHYVKNTGSSCVWQTDEHKTPAKKSSRARIEKIISPIFSELAQLINDEFWKDIFQKGSNGRFPSGFRLVGGELVYRKRTKTDSLVIPSNSSHVSEIIEFFREHGICSPNDQQHNKDLLTNELNEQERIKKQLTWTGVRRNRTLFRLLTENFVHEKTQEYNLSPIERDELKGMIYLGSSAGILENKNVVINDFRIVEVTNLTFDREHWVFTDIPRLPRSSRSSTKAIERNDPSYNTMWTKFLDKYTADLTGQKKELKNSKANINGQSSNHWLKNNDHTEEETSEIQMTEGTTVDDTTEDYMDDVYNGDKTIDFNNHLGKSLKRTTFRLGGMFCK